MSKTAKGDDYIYQHLMYLHRQEHDQENCMCTSEVAGVYKNIKQEVENRFNDMLADILECLPEKKYVNPKNTEPDFYANDEGYNQAIDEMRKSVTNYFKGGE